jgi:hypothetical protein
VQGVNEQRRNLHSECPQAQLTVLNAGSEVESICRQSRFEDACVKANRRFGDHNESSVLARKGDIRCDDVPDPKIEHGRDAVIKMTACAICGSDLHLMDGYIPFMEKGDVLGHEFMGEVVEVGSDNKKLKMGDRVELRITQPKRLVIRLQVYLVTHTSRGHMPAVRRNKSGFPMRTFPLSSFRMG